MSSARTLVFEKDKGNRSMESAEWYFFILGKNALNLYRKIKQCGKKKQESPKKAFNCAQNSETLMAFSPDD